MKISGGVVRQLVERSKHELSHLRQVYDNRFIEIISNIEADGFGTREIVRGNEKKFNELLSDVEKRKKEAEKFFKDFIGKTDPTLPDITVRCTDISELQRCLTQLNNLSLYEWVHDIAQYPQEVKKQLKNILLTPRKKLKLPKDDENN